MSIVIAPDKFKGTLSAPAVAAALANGVRSVRPGAPLALCPMADGGEGTLDVLLAARRGQRRRVACRGPFGDAIDADVGLIDGAAVAVVELAQAAGWTTLAGRRPDPLVASTFGVGELLGAALEAQVSRIVLALGGSVTVDGGCGLAQALGLELFDAAGRRMASPLPPGRLEEVRYVESAAMTARFADVALSIAADVLNPLLGPSGASRTFGPQKGADAAGVERLERRAGAWAGVLESASGWLLRDEPGGGDGGAHCR
ncbi:MAG: glycerate kinase [Phycisphaerae bacterium]